MKRRGLSYLLVFMLILGMFPAGVASATASDGVETVYLDLKSRAVGSATLSLDGTTLTLQAAVRTNSTEETTYMQAVRLTLGGTSVLNTTLSGGEQKAFTRVVQNVNYETMKNYHLEVDLITGGGGGGGKTETKTFVSTNGFPGGAVEQTYSNEDSRYSWNDLAWNPESAGLAGSITNKAPLAYMREAGALWVYNRANSMIINKEDRANFNGDFALPADAVISAATLAITADDGYGFSLGGTVLPLPSNHNMTIDGNGAPVLKKSAPGVPHGAYHFQAVNAYDIKSLLHGGSNPFCVQVYNRLGNKGCENVAGLIFRADVTYTTAGGGGDCVTGTSRHDGTLKPGGKTPDTKIPKLGLRIDLIKINGQAVTGQAVCPGDKLTFTLTMKNEGNVDVRPDGATIAVPSGMSASKADNPDARLSVSGNTIYYTHPGTMIPVGGSDAVEFTLCVLPGTTGNQTITASAPYLYTSFGDRVANPTPNADFTVTINASTPKGNAKLCITHELIKVNDVAVNSSTVIRPGDKLTLRMNMANQGSFAVRPSTIPVNFSSGLYAQASDNSNPPWTTYTTSLLYTHDGTFISPGTSRSVEYVLRVRADASGNQTIDSNVPSVIDESGNTVPNDTPKGGTSIVVVPQGSTDVCGNLQITHQLIKINGNAYRPGDVIRQGDVLTFNMIMKNVGNAPVRPDTIQVNFSSGLYAQPGDNTNPPWATYSNYLVYTHDGTLIGAGSAANVSYVLRVRADASGQQRVDTCVPTIIDANGRTITNTSPNASTTIEIGQAYSDCRLDITHTLIRVNDVAVNSNTVIRPGDKLTFSMTMTNTGNVPVRPDTIPVYFSSGLYAQASDNSNPPWTTYSSYLLYTHTSGLINAGMSQSVEYVLRVRSDATGTQSVWTELPTLVDVHGNVVNNGGTQKVTITIIIAPDGTTVQISTKFWLSAVNGIATGINPDDSMQRITLVPGDVLTYTLRSINSGAQSAAPGEYTVTLPSNQTFSAAENPGWFMRDGLLVYAYNGPLLAPGAQIDALLHLKLNTNAVKGNQTFTYTYNLTKVRMPDGTVVSNNNPATVSIPVCIGKFGDMDKTGDSGLGWMPVMLGSILLVGSGTTLFMTRRRRLRGK